MQSENIRRIPFSLTRGRQLEYPSSTEENVLRNLKQRDENGVHGRIDGDINNKDTTCISIDNKRIIPRQYFEGTIQMSIISRHVDEGVSRSSSSSWQTPTSPENDENLPSYNEAVMRGTE